MVLHNFSYTCYVLLDVKLLWNKYYMIDSFIHSFIFWHVSEHVTLADIFNPLRAKFFGGNKNIYSHFMSFLYIDMR